MTKRSFYRAANAILGKMGGRATEDVILQLISSKCLPVLAYCMAWKRVLCAKHADSNSLDFVVNRLFMKLFKTSNIDTVNYCRSRTEFQFELLCTVLEQRRRKFVAKYRSCDNVCCKFV